MDRPVPSLLVLLLLVAGCGGGSGDAGADPASSGSTSSAEAADVPEDLCAELSVDEAGAAIGAEATLEAGPIGCEVGQEDPRGLSGIVGTTPVDDATGGFEGYVSGARATLDDPTVHDLDGIGEAAFLATGTIAGGESLQGAGGALVGDVVVTVNVSQASGLTDAEVTEAGTKLLELAVAAVR